MFSTPTERNAGEGLARLVEVSWNWRKADSFSSRRRISVAVRRGENQPRGSGQGRHDGSERSNQRSIKGRHGRLTSSVLQPPSTGHEAQSPGVR